MWNSSTLSRPAKFGVAFAAAAAVLAATPAVAGAAKNIPLTPTILPPGYDTTKIVDYATKPPSTVGFSGADKQGSPWVGGLVGDISAKQFTELAAAGAPVLPGLIVSQLIGANSTVDFSTFYKTGPTSADHNKALGSISYAAQDLGNIFGFQVTNELYSLYGAWGSRAPWYKVYPETLEGDYSTLSKMGMWSYGGDQLTFASKQFGAFTTGAEVKGFRGDNGLTSFTPIIDGGYAAPGGLFSGMVFASPGSIQYGTGSFGLSGPALQAQFKLLGMPVQGGFVLPAASYVNGNLVLNTGSVNAFGFSTPAQNISIGKDGFDVKAAPASPATDITTSIKDRDQARDAIEAAAKADKAAKDAADKAAKEDAPVQAAFDPAPAAAPVEPAIEADDLPEAPEAETVVATDATVDTSVSTEAKNDAGTAGLS